MKKNKSTTSFRRALAAAAAIIILAATSSCTAATPRQPGPPAPAQPQSASSSPAAQPRPSAASPQPSPEAYTRYSAEFFQLFDTHMIFLAYTRTKEEFDLYCETVRGVLEKLDKLYDVYDGYPDMANIKTVNDNAGVAPVAVSREILDLVKFGKEAHTATGGTVNIALGAVLRLWHDARDTAGENLVGTYIPPMDQLREALKNTDINNVIIDESAGTVFLKNPGMSLDVGALAKGYAAEIAFQAAKDAGLTSGILSAGGNILTTGKPMDGRERWSVGIRDPEGGAADLVDNAYTNDTAVVTSGDYQRYYIVDGAVYHHIIDPATLMPAARYAGVTVLHPNSGVSDMLSTAMFILPEDDGKALLDTWGAHGLWVYHDGTMEATQGYKEMSKTFGGLTG